ncbi:MAG: twin-arginine translocase subunit TatC [Spirochaetia bacterium]|jgi:sec-independent protein translocase protein TatC|nr:twin-arginine translocase subunit TatC [Spirochaetia bacterium]
MKDMPFLDHLEILRRKLLIYLAGFLLLSIFFFISGERLLNFLTAPLSGIPVSLVYIRPQEKITAYLNASILAGFIISFPLLVIQIAHFIFPALRKEEKLSFFFVTLFVIILFITGSAFAYMFLLPFACTFFFSFASGDGIKPLWSVGTYVELASSLIFIIGCVFQAPLPVLFFVKTGVIDKPLLKKYRRHVLVAVFIVSAIITPPDIYTQAAVGTVLYLLFEITLFISGFLTRGEKR